jgi:hypothetical protein
MTVRMMTVRVMTIALTIAMAIGSMVAPAWAGGPADDPPCVIANPGGSTALRGTIAAHVQNAATQGNTDVDFTLRLERGGALAFFRASVNMQVFARSNEGILCDLLNSNNTQAAADLRAAILRAFGLPSTALFWLTDKSISNAEIQGVSGQWFCNNTYTDPTMPAGPCGATQRGGSMADVILYVK